MVNGLNHFPLYIDRWRSGTRGLDGRERVILFEVITDCYAEAGPVHVDVEWLARDMRFKQGSVRATLVRLVEKGKLEVTSDGLYWCPACAEVIASVTQKSDKAKAAVQARERKRAEQRAGQSRPTKERHRISGGSKQSLAGTPLDSNSDEPARKSEKNQWSPLSSDDRSIIGRSSREREREKERLSLTTTTGERDRPRDPTEPPSSSSLLEGDFSQIGRSVGAAPAADVRRLFEEDDALPIARQIISICKTQEARAWHPESVADWVRRARGSGWSDDQLIEVARIARQSAPEAITSPKYLTGVMRNMVAKQPDIPPPGGSDVRPTGGDRLSRAEEQERRAREAEDRAIEALHRKFGGDLPGDP